MDNEPLKVGDVVKFREVVDAGDDLYRGAVVEVNGSRCLVAAIGTGMTVVPTHVYLVRDLVKADDAK